MKNGNVSDQCPPNLANRRQRISKIIYSIFFLNISTVRYKSMNRFEIYLKNTKTY